ncbi:MAG: hypothetical protein AAGB29_07680 [Planctomycetota bacterium]
MWFRRRKEKSAIDAVRFDTSGWKQHESSAEHRLWLTPSSDAVALRRQEPPPAYPYDFRSLPAARAFYAEESAQRGGVMISVDFVDSSGIDVMRGVFKYRSPEPGSLAMYYVGVIALLRRTCAFQINAESVEVGSTGAREAAVMAMGDGPPALQEEEVVVASASDLFAKMGEARIKRLPADDERYDDMFPDHPLSKVRSLQKRILETLEVDDSFREQPPYRK